MFEGHEANVKNGVWQRAVVVAGSVVIKLSYIFSHSNGVGAMPAHRQRVGRARCAKGMGIANVGWAQRLMAPT